jgi:Icc-related predicted phosphoesterase
MKILQLSDLHLEFEDYRPKEKSDMLMLNGDICVAEYLNKTKASKYFHLGERFKEFFKYCADNYEHVLYIMGNHEHYVGRYDKSYNSIKNNIDHRTTILDDSSIDIEGYRFIGTTLWTDLNKSNPITEYYLKDSISDFKVIDYNDCGIYRKFSPYDSFLLHKKALASIDELSANQENVFVMSHHAPSSLSVHKKYVNEFHMNGGFHSDLLELILDRPQIKYWTHGHMHDCFDYKLGNTRVVCNPKGYYNENKNFNEFNILEI